MADFSGLDHPFETNQPEDPYADPRPRYRLCRAAFTLGALALGLQSAEIALSLLARFGDIPELMTLFRDPNWPLYIGTPITWSAVLGSILLLGRWPGSWWARRAGLLVLFNAFDLLFWASDSGPVLGFRLPELQDPWVRHVGSVLQWFELLLFSSLAAYVCERLGQAEAGEATRRVRSLAILGVVFWAITLVGCTDLSGWPPRFQLVSLELLLILLGSRFLLGLTAFQVMWLCVLAARACRRQIADLHRAENEPESLRSRSEDGFPEPTDPWRSPRKP